MSKSVKNTKVISELVEEEQKLKIRKKSRKEQPEQKAPEEEKVSEKVAKVVKKKSTKSQPCKGWVELKGADLRSVKRRIEKGRELKFKTKSIGDALYRPCKQNTKHSSGFCHNHKDQKGKPPKPKSTPCTHILDEGEESARKCSKNRKGYEGDPSDCLCWLHDPELAEERKRPSGDEEDSESSEDEEDGIKTKRIKKGKTCCGTKADETACTKTSRTLYLVEGKWIAFCHSHTPAEVAKRNAKSGKNEKGEKETRYCSFERVPEGKSFRRCARSVGPGKDRCYNHPVERDEEEEEEVEVRKPRKNQRKKVKVEKEVEEEVEEESTESDSAENEEEVKDNAEESEDEGFFDDSE